MMTVLCSCVTNLYLVLVVLVVVIVVVLVAVGISVVVVVSEQLRELEYFSMNNNNDKHSDKIPNLPINKIYYEVEK